MSTSLSSDAASPTPETGRWLEDHGDALFRYALVRVRNRETSEDLVQDTLLAALRAKDRFAGRSSIRTWLTGILKNKIIDYYRKLGRETTFTDLSFLRDECAEKFDSSGFWQHDQGLGPKEWKPPSDEVLHRAEFWQVMRTCLDKLPPRVAQVFTLRVVDDLSSKEVCQVTAVSESNLWVMLHRARMALRECFERNWFDRPTN
jgi:RNA polymerase sigma-70 factor (ECF subfamily)